MSVLEKIVPHPWPVHLPYSDEAAQVRNELYPRAEELYDALGRQHGKLDPDQSREALEVCIDIGMHAEAAKVRREFQALTPAQRRRVHRLGKIGLYRSGYYEEAILPIVAAGKSDRHALQFVLDEAANTVPNSGYGPSWREEYHSGPIRDRDLGIPFPPTERQKAAQVALDKRYRQLNPVAARNVDTRPTTFEILGAEAELFLMSLSSRDPREFNSLDWAAVNRFVAATQLAPWAGAKAKAKIYNSAYYDDPAVGRALALMHNAGIGNVSRLFKVNPLMGQIDGIHDRLVAATSRKRRSGTPPLSTSPFMQWVDETHNAFVDATSRKSTPTKSPFMQRLDEAHDAFVAATSRKRRSGTPPLSGNSIMRGIDRAHDRFVAATSRENVAHVSKRTVFAIGRTTTRLIGKGVAVVRGGSKAEESEPTVSHSES